jgi:RND family efflux transporter MFP subunit
MKKTGYIIIGIVLFAMAAIFIGRSLFKTEEKNTGNYRNVIVTRRDIHSSVLATGIIKPMVGAEVRVGSRVSGIVKKLFANIGDVVKKGQLIAELDPIELQAKYDQTLAGVKNARASSEYATLDLERQKSLLKQNLISQNQLDLAEKSFDISQSQYEQAEANLAFANVQLNYTRIVAPIEGVVASISTQEGETVAASFSAPTFVNIIDLNRLEVWVFVDETDIGRIQVDQKATFTVDTYMETDFEGTVTAIYPKAVIQDNVVNYITTIRITDFKDKLLRPDMTTTVRIFLKTKKNVLTIARVAVRRENSSYLVTRLENGQPVPKQVKTGWSNNEYIEIIEGLQEGDKIIVNN